MNSCPIEYMNDQLSGYSDTINNYAYKEEEDNNISKEEYIDKIDDNIVYKR